jgi:tripartite-type tricarboxylate transporter receptor subunit TctC
MSFTSHAINASLYPRLPFDPVKDFTPLTLVSTSPSVLVAHPSVPANNVAELVALARAKPGQFNFAIGALGSSLHLAGEAFKLKAGVFIVNIPYRGTAPAVQDVLAGQVELMFAAVGNMTSVRLARFSSWQASTCSQNSYSAMGLTGRPSSAASSREMA